MPHDGATAWLQQRTARPVCGNRCWVPFTQQASYGAATASHAPLLKSHQGGCTQNTAGNADRLMSQISSHACCCGVCCFLQQQRFSPHAVQVMLASKAAALLVQRATAILCAGCNCRNPCRTTATAAQAPRSRMLLLQATASPSALLLLLRRLLAAAVHAGCCRAGGQAAAQLLRQAQHFC